MSVLESVMAGIMALIICGGFVMMLIGIAEWIFDDA